MHVHIYAYILNCESMYICMFVPTYIHAYLIVYLRMYI